MSLTFGKVTLTEVACALILGILTNLLCSIKAKKPEAPADTAEATVAADMPRISRKMRTKRPRNKRLQSKIRR